MYIKQNIVFRVQIYLKIFILPSLQRPIWLLNITHVVNITRHDQRKTLDGNSEQYHS